MKKTLRNRVPGNRVWAAAVAGVLAMVGFASAAAAGAAAEVPVAGLISGPVVGVADDPPDQLVFKDGRVIKGRVLEETETQVRFLVIVAGIEGEQTYNKADLLAIDRGPEGGEGGAKAEATTQAHNGDGADHPDAPVDANAPGVYVVNIEGHYGRDITPTSVRQIAKDIVKHKPQYVILVIDNTWGTLSGQEFGDDVNQFDQLFLTEDIEPIFTKELPVMLGYSPKIVAWVKNAMGGAAFLPLNFDTIYFSSDGRIGGIGRLEQIFGSTGDKRVREKQFSLRLGHARGMANNGGYDARIIEAMARTDYVLSYRIENGKAVLINAEPDIDRGEVLLTDDGKGDNEDTIQERAREQGNDNLTLTADIAKTIGISKGTVDDLDSLLYELEIDRNARVIDTREERIRKQWTRGVESAERQLRDLMQEYSRIQVGGERRERQAARSRQIATLRKIISLLERYDEVIKVRMFRMPPGVPSVPQIEVLIEQITQEQMKDRP